MKKMTLTRMRNQLSMCQDKSFSPEWYNKRECKWVVCCISIHMLYIYITTLKIKSYCSILMVLKLNMIRSYTVFLQDGTTLYMLYRNIRTTCILSRILSNYILEQLAHLNCSSWYIWCRATWTQHTQMWASITQAVCELDLQVHF